MKMPNHDEYRKELLEFPHVRPALQQELLLSPQVRAITGFLLKLWAGEKELAQVRITVCPANVFSQLKGIGIEVQEPGELLAPLLKEAEHESEKKLTIVRLPGQTAKWNANELAPAVLYLVSPGVKGAERLMPLKFLREDGRRVAILQDWFVPDLQQNALSQLRLLRAIDLMLKPEQVQGPKPRR